MSDDHMHEIKKLLSTNVIQKYKQVLLDGLRCSFPLLTDQEILEAIDYSIINRYKSSPARINNNYTKQEIKGTLLDMISYIESLEPIMTSSGVLYKKHKEADNPLSRMIMGFIKQRKVFKKTMFKFPKSSADFEKYNLLQLLEKLNANATYGKEFMPRNYSNIVVLIF